MPEVQEHIITALVQNEAGTLNRLVSLFRRRGFSLASLNAGRLRAGRPLSLHHGAQADQNELNQCLRQLEKLIDVVEVEDLGRNESVRRELCLVRVDRPADNGARSSRS